MNDHNLNNNNDVEEEFTAERKCSTSSSCSSGFVSRKSSDSSNCSSENDSEEIDQIEMVLSRSDNTRQEVDQQSSIRR